MADYKARVQITAGVAGAELIDRFGNKLNTVGKTADSVNRQMSSLNGAVKLLAAGFGASQIAGLTAEFARATIQLDAYGKQLGVSFGAGAGGTRELEFLRQTMRGLGIAQDEALGSAVRFTSALKLSGQTAQEANRAFESASKLILSNKLSAEGANRVFYAMGQIASKGKLMSEELNGQLGDTLAGFTQQVANAMGKSTAQLLNDMSKGKVASTEFFEALQKIGDGIDPAQLNSAARSLGDVKNAWFDLRSGILKSEDIKHVLDSTAMGLRFLAENSQTVAAVIGGVLTSATAAYVGKAVGSAVASRAASVALVEEARAAQTAAVAQAELALTTLNVARANGVLGVSMSAAAAEMVVASRAVVAANAEMKAAQAAVGGFANAGRGLVAMMGGPWGIAFAAAAGAVYLLSNQLSTEERLEQAVEASSRALGNAHTAISHLIDQRTGKTLALTEAMRLQYMQELRLNGAKTATTLSEAGGAAGDVVRDRNRGAFTANDRFAQGGIGPAARGGVNAGGMAVAEMMKQGASPESILAAARKSGTFVPAGSFHKYVAAYNNNQTAVVAQKLATKGVAGLSKDELALANAAGMYTPDAPKPTAAVSTGGGGRTRRSTGPSAERVEDQYQTMLNSITQEDLRTRNDLLHTTQERYQAERDTLKIEIDKRSADIASSKHMSDAQKENLTLAVAQLSMHKQAVIAAREHDQLNREQTDAYIVDLEGKLDMLRSQEAMATTLANRNRIQLSILDAETEIERAKQQEVISSQTASEAEKNIARQRMAQIYEKRDAQAAQISDGNLSPLKQWMKQVPQTADEMQEAINNIKANGLQDLSDGLTGLIDGTKGVGEAFRSMSDGIIADLARIAIQKLIVNAIGLFANGGAFEGGTQLLANGGAFSGGTQFFAAGGVVTRPTAFGMSGGKMGVMGEAGPEAIMPLRRLPGGRLGVEAMGSGGTQNNVTVNVSVDGGSSDVDASGQQAAQLGRVISNVVRQELVNQSRPGGLLSR